MQGSAGKGSPLLPGLLQPLDAQPGFGQGAIDHTLHLLPEGVPVFVLHGAMCGGGPELCKFISPSVSTPK